MARVTHVKSARKDQGSCSNCSTPIKKGDSYKWFANRIGRSSIRKNFCSNCRIRPSQMTTSHHLAGIYSAQENFEDQIGDLTSVEDIESLLTETSEAIKEVAEGYRESAQNIEDGFGHATQMSEELTERADELESQADEIEQASGEIEDFDEDSARDEIVTEVESEYGTPEEEFGDELREVVSSQLEERREAHWEEQREKASDPVNNVG